MHDQEAFPSLKTTELVILDSAYAELKPAETASLTLIPPAMTGPPELVWLDKVETKTPGIWAGNVGRGRIIWLPWNPGGPYYRYSSPGHAGLVLDMVDRLLPQGRQLRTDAHPLIEMTVMYQPERKRTLVHLVNVSGHSSTGYFSPLTTGPITLDLAGMFARGRLVRHGGEATVSAADDRTRFTVPSVADYEVVVLE